MRHRRRRLHGHPHARRARDHDRLARDGAGGDAARLLLRERRAAGVQGRALQRALGRRARHGARLEPRAAALRLAAARRGSRRAIPSPARASSSTRRSPPRRTDNPPYFDDLPPRATLFLDPDGTAQDVGTSSGTRTWRRRLRLIARAGAERLLPRAVAQAHRHAVQAPPHGPDADQTWRPGLMTVRDLAATRRTSAADPRAATAATTSTAWARRPPAARPSARR